MPKKKTENLSGVNFTTKDVTMTQAIQNLVTSTTDKLPTGNYIDVDLEGLNKEIKKAEEVVKKLKIESLDTDLSEIDSLIDETLKRNDLKEEDDTVELDTDSSDVSKDVNKVNEPKDVDDTNNMPMDVTADEIEADLTTEAEDEPENDEVEVIAGGDDEATDSNSSNMKTAVVKIELPEDVDTNDVNVSLDLVDDEVDADTLIEPSDEEGAELDIDTDDENVEELDIDDLDEPEESDDNMEIDEKEDLNVLVGANTSVAANSEELMGLQHGKLKQLGRNANDFKFVDNTDIHSMLESLSRHLEIVKTLRNQIEETVLDTSINKLDDAIANIINEDKDVQDAIKNIEHKFEDGYNDTPKEKLGKKVKENTESATIEFTLLPIAENATWNAGGAIKRVEALATKEDTTIDYSILEAACLFVDKENNKSFNGYKYQIADVINGKLMAIPSAIKKLADFFSNDDALVSMCISEDVINTVRGKLKVYLEAIGETAPWDNKDVSTLQITENGSLLKIFRRAVEYDPFKSVKVLKENKGTFLKD